MKPLSLSWIAQVVNGRLQGADHTVRQVVTDTRTLDAAGTADALFVALQGERFDGHDHVSAAARAGVRAALVARPVDAAVAQIIVADTEQALAALARAVQAMRATRVIGVTGSNGKTSVKTLLLSILQQTAGDGRVVYANPGNRNNEIGLPLAVLDAPDNADWAVYEMGAGKPGDIAYLTAIARPNVSLVSNIAPAHLERLGTLLAVADTKAAIYDALPADGVAVINADDAFAPYFGERARGRRILRFGLEASADISATAIRLHAAGSTFHLHTPDGEAEVELALPGRHNVRNALAATALALGAGVPLQAIVTGLQAARSVAGRLLTHRLQGGAVLVDDSYNANPGSVAVAIDTLASGDEPAWLVLGDMRELGEDAVALHAEVGRRAKATGIARLYALGALSAHAADAFGSEARHFDSHADLAAALLADLRATPAVRVLVKGSRGSAMDRIVAALLQAEPPRSAPTPEGTADAA